MKRTLDDLNRQSRRKMLALIGAAGVGVLAGRNRLAASRDSDDPDTMADDGLPAGVQDPVIRDEPPVNGGNFPSDDDPRDRNEDGTDSPPGVDITAYGARSNPDDATAEEAADNLRALRIAARIAGDGGTIYVPEGQFHIGHSGTGLDPHTEFGGREPSGISIVGDGPDRSILTLSRHINPERQGVQDGFRWSDGTYHGTFEIKHVTLDGNYQNIEYNIRGAGGRSRGCDVNGEGELHLKNTRIRGWQLNGCRAGSLLRTASYCTFEDNGIKVHNESEGDSISHHLSVDPSSDEEVLIEHCHFIDSGGSAVNWTYGSGTVEIRSCYVEGTGANLCKHSSSGTLKLKNVFHRANTESLESKLLDLGPSDGFMGRNLIQRVRSTGEGPATVEFDNVESRDITDYAIQSRQGELRLTGDLLAIHNANMLNDDEVIRNRSGGRFIDVDIDRLSVHDCDGQIFDTDGSTGRVNTIRYSAVQGLGDSGGISVFNVEEEEAPFEPSVPARDDVGIQGFEES